MSKISMSMFSALLAMSLFATGSSASPTTPGATWSWGGLFVDTYVVFDNGDIGASFENSAGTAFTTWNNASGVNQCPGQPTLHVASGYVPAPELQKLLLQAAVSHKALHVWFEATGGICYIKALASTM